MDALAFVLILVAVFVAQDFLNDALPELDTWLAYLTFAMLFLLAIAASFAAVWLLSGVLQ